MSVITIRSPNKHSVAPPCLGRKGPKGPTWKMEFLVIFLHTYKLCLKVHQSQSRTKKYKKLLRCCICLFVPKYICMTVPIVKVTLSRFGPKLTKTFPWKIF